MSLCKVCNRTASEYTLHNKKVCFSCDEMLFDMEIELEEFEVEKPRPASPEPERLKRRLPKTTPK